MVLLNGVIDEVVDFLVDVFYIESLVVGELLFVVEYDFVVVVWIDVGVVNILINEFLYVVGLY